MRIHSRRPSDAPFGLAHTVDTAAPVLSKDEEHAAFLAAVVDATPNLALRRLPSIPMTSRGRHLHGLRAPPSRFGVTLLEVGGAHVIGHCIAPGDTHDACTSFDARAGAFYHSSTS